MDTSVMIIGGGLGGLALAQGLGASGVRAVVFERDPAPDHRAQGFRISMNDLGVNALRTLLSKERFEELGALEVRDLGRKFTFASASSTRPLLHFKPGAETGAPTVSRPGLRRLLATGIDVRWGKRLASFSDVPGGVEARFTDGTRARADILVGCDGSGSMVREQIGLGREDQTAAPLPVLRSTDLISIGGTLERTPEWDRLLPLACTGAVQHLGPRGHSLFVSYCERENGQPLLLWVLTHHDPIMASDEAALRARSKDDLQRHAVERLAHDGWHPTLRRLVAETPAGAMIDPHSIKTTDIAKKRTAPLWPSGRVLLIGDAAHTMPPQRGIGGAHAFEDARALRELLVPAIQSEIVDWRALTFGFEKAMFERAREAVDESVQTAEMCHTTSAIKAGARNAILRVVQLGLRLRGEERAPRAA